DENSFTKIMLLCISRFMDRRTLRGSSMSYAQIAKACGFSDSTAIRSAKAARGWLRIEVNQGRYVPGKGNENLYHGVVPERWVEELRRQRRHGQDVKIDEGIVKAAD